MMQNLCTMLAGRHVLVLLHAQRHDGVQLQLHDGPVQVRADRDRLLRDLHLAATAKCCEMIQSCCDCLACMCNAGCTCCLLMNNTPVCCGYSESYCSTTAKTKR